MTRIEVMIDEVGNATVEAVGAAGKSCKALTADIEKALGKTVEDKLKPEFHQQDQTQNQRAKF